MKYYTYEYEILLVLSQIFKIESININSDFYNAVKTIRNSLGKLETKVVLRKVTGELIQLNFDLDFHYKFDRRILRDAFRFVKHFLERETEC